MNQNECEGQSCTLTAVPQDLALPAEHEDVVFDQRRTTANEHGTHQRLWPPKICDYVLNDKFLGLFVFVFST